MNRAESGIDRPVVLRLEVTPTSLKGPGGTLPIREDDRLLRDLLLLLLGQVGGVPLKEALDKFGYRSRGTYYSKLKRFIKRGLLGLLPQPSGPRGKWRRSGDIVRRIIAMRQAQKSAAQISKRLAELGIRISVRSVERTLTECGLTNGNGEPTQ